MNWTHDLPSEPGYYWWRSKAGATADIVSVVTSDKFLHPSQRGIGPTSLFLEIPGQAHARRGGGGQDPTIAEENNARNCLRLQGVTINDRVPTYRGWGKNK